MKTPWQRRRARGSGWPDPRFVVLVLNNRDLGYVRGEQRVMEGDPRYAATQSIPDLPYADVARLFGFDGVRVQRPEDVAGAWERALASDQPFLIDAGVDRNVPTLPPAARARAGGPAHARAERW